MDDQHPANSSATPSTPANGTQLTDQQADDLNARTGRGARPEPGAEHDQHDLEARIDRESSTELLDPELGPRETRQKEE